MRQRRPAIDRMLWIAAVGVLAALPARAEVIHGFARAVDYNGAGGSITVGVDFSTQLTFRIDMSNRHLADLQASIPVGPGGGCSTWLVSFNGTTGRSVPGTTLEELEVAPESPYCCIPSPELNETCVLLTVDGLYVKYAVRSIDETETGGECIFGGVDIEFFVQTNGTRDFGPVLPVESSTWGRIKALYR
ncbi:MAG: hypothetical protein L0Z51_11030 [Candidatus Latescibacteria bacterium]|nr:hypothetical protein [Candidatus Latescibacterota bacterium]